MVELHAEAAPDINTAPIPELARSLHAELGLWTVSYTICAEHPNTVPGIIAGETPGVSTETALRELATQTHTLSSQGLAPEAITAELFRPRRELGDESYATLIRNRAAGRLAELPELRAAA